MKNYMVELVKSISEAESTDLLNPENQKIGLLTQFPYTQSTLILRNYTTP